MNDMKTEKLYKDLNGLEFQQKLSENPEAVLLDVRTTEEFQGGRIPYARSLDVTDVTFSERISALDKGKTYFVYCRSGGRSGHACSVMSKQGFTVINLAGGIMNWTGELC